MKLRDLDHHLESNRSRTGEIDDVWLESPKADSVIAKRMDNCQIRIVWQGLAAEAYVDMASLYLLKVLVLELGCHHGHVDTVATEVFDEAGCCPTDTIHWSK